MYHGTFSSVVWREIMRKSWGELSFFIFLDIHWRIQDIRGGVWGSDPVFLTSWYFFLEFCRNFVMFKMSLWIQEVRCKWHLLIYIVHVCIDFSIHGICIHVITSWIIWIRAPRTRWIRLWHIWRKSTVYVSFLSILCCI